MDKKEVILDYLGEGEIFCQLAEEASELAQAALEYHMSHGYYRNMSTISREQAYHNLIEEVADVTLCLQMLGVDCQEVSDSSHEISKRPVLCCLAKEAAELSKAALKCRRAYGFFQNVTPVTKEEAHQNLAKKVADVMLCIRISGLDHGTAADEVHEIMEAKIERWYQRLYDCVVRNKEELE